jgi:alpha-L-rhamnosidase
MVLSTMEGFELDRSALDISDVYFEHYQPADTVGVGDTRPRLSWKFSPAPPGFQQEGYQIDIYEEIPGSTKLICSVKEEKSSQCQFIPWPGKDPLHSRQKVLAYVKAWGKVWSQPGVGLHFLKQAFYPGKIGNANV